MLFTEFLHDNFLLQSNVDRKQHAWYYAVLHKTSKSIDLLRQFH